MTRSVRAGKSQLGGASITRRLASGAGARLSAADRSVLWHQAVRKALSLRQRLGIGPYQAVSPFHVARLLGLDTWFLDAPTLEGMYVAGTPGEIFISSHRPSGRQAMTCAHEIGHFEFGHGARVDEHRGPGLSQVEEPDEYLANTFASHFLATRSAIVNALQSRGLSSNTLTPENVFAVASWLGIGYAALIHHLRSALGAITPQRADALLRVQPKDVRASLATRFSLGTIGGDLLVADHLWVDRAIDAQVDDVILVPPSCEVEGKCVRLLGRAITTLTPGTGRVLHAESGWSAFIRVARRNYVGLAEYRHLAEEVDAA